MEATLGTQNLKEETVLASFQEHLSKYTEEELAIIRKNLNETTEIDGTVRTTIYDEIRKFNNPPRRHE